MRTSLNLKMPARLTNAALLTFTKLVLSEAEALKDESVFTNCINVLDEKYGVYSTAMNLDKTNKMTESLVAMMATMTTDFRIAKTIAQTLALVKDEDLAKIAAEVIDVNTKYGEFLYNEYSEKLAKFNLWVVDVEKIGDEELTKLGLKPFVAEIKELAKTFETSYQARNDFREYRKGKVQEARADVQAAYEDFAVRVEAMANLDNAVCQKLAGNINEYLVWFLMDNGQKDVIGTQIVNETLKEEVGDETESC